MVVRKSVRIKLTSITNSVSNMVVALLNKSIIVFSVLVCLGGSDGYQEVVQTAAGNTDINHGCPSWFVPINNSSDRCKCGEPIHYPGRVVLCNLNTNQTMVRIGFCMDYHKGKDIVFVGVCSYQKGASIYAKPPQDAVELNKCLCGRLNRTGVMCNQCQKGLGTAIFSYSMQCLHCMNSGLGWTLYMFLATFPTTILFLVVLIFQCRCITSGPMNAFICACQVIVSTANYSLPLQDTTLFGVISWMVFDIYGIWNLGLFSLPPSSILCE